MRVDQGSLFPEWEGHDLRDQGIQRVSDHNIGWLERTRVEAERFIHSQTKPFTGEDIRFHCQAIVGVPAHPNAWGALINALIKSAMLVHTGGYKHPKDRSSHARMIKLYVKP